MELIVIFEIIALLFFAFFFLVLLFFRKRLIWIIISGLLFGITILISIYGLVIVFSSYGNDVKINQTKEFTIRKGSNLFDISDTLYKNGVIDSRRKFKWIFKIFRFDKKLKAGKYQITEKNSYYSLMLILNSGNVIQEKVTIPEGLRTEKIASILSEKIEINKEKFLSLIDDKEFIKKFELDTISLNGYLLPETYQFYWGMDEQEVITIFMNEFKKLLTDSVIAQISKSEYSLRDYIILASIIEGEALHDEERSIISAVFHNRLKLNLKLQADPTIQYIISDGPRHLLKDDLEIDSPYNTYLYAGLPPGPICNPGAKSILSAIFPAKNGYIYFVAKGDGYHIFSKNQKEHLKAKKTLDKLRLKLKNSHKSD
jgi:UPF0755 protein